LIHGGKIEYETQSKLLPIGNSEITSVTGKAMAGTLSLVSKLIGTPYFPSLVNHLIFLEDVDERVHKIESYLEHVSLSGVLQGSSGLILGEFTPAESEEYKVLPKQEDVFQRVLRNVRIPLFSGFNYGHIPNLFSVPIGMELTVHPGENKTVIESTHPFFES
jgi:muramoyltetrapeptide carboxypeptidase